MLSRLPHEVHLSYLYRAVDSSGATVDFLLSAKRDTVAAKRFLAKALGGANHPHPHVINTDKDAAYPPAIVQLKAEGVLDENCGHRPVRYLWQCTGTGSSRDQSAGSARASIFAPFGKLGARRAGCEAIHKIRQGQACWSEVGANVGLLHRFIVGMFGLEA
jgi:transposase, IS6 family